MRDSMVLYRSFAEAMDELPAEQYKETMQAITRYAMDGIEPECSGVVKAIFLMAKPQIDANNKRYENGKRGGKPKKHEQKPSDNQTVTKPEPNETKPEPNVNVNVNVNDNVSKEKEILKKKKAEFEALWAEYPRKQGKKDAERHYLAATKDGVTFEEAMNGIKAYKEYIAKTGTDPQYIKMGSAFFCQRAWGDDWTVHKPKPKSRSDTYVPEPPKYPVFEPEPEVETTQMPDEIRARLGAIFDE